MRWREIEWSHPERGFHLVHKSIVSLFSKLFEKVLHGVIHCVPKFRK
jgi:hypothetical protein